MWLKKPKLSQTLIHKPAQAVTKLGMRRKYEYSSSLMHGTDEEEWHKVYGDITK